MIDPLTIGTQIIGIVNIINQAVQLIDALKAAPSELKSTARHVQSLAIVLEGVRSEVLENPHSIVNNTRNQNRQAKRSELARLLKDCDRSVQKVKALLNRYHELDRSTWLRWRWSSKGKQEVDGILGNMAFEIQMLDLFMSNQHSVSLGRLETAVENVSKEQGQKLDTVNFKLDEMIRALGLTISPVPVGGDVRYRYGGSWIKRPSIGAMVYVSWFVSRLKARLERKRRFRNGHGFRRSSSFPRPMVRVRSIPLENKRRTRLSEQYAQALVDEQSDKKLDSGNEHLECWLVVQGQYSFGLPPICDGRPVKRGQQQLREMASLFEAGGPGSSCVAGRNDPAVKWALRQKRNSRYRWTCAAARVESRESSAHGSMRLKKVPVVLKRVS